MSDKIQLKDSVVLKGNNVSIGTQLEEETMQGYQIIDTTD